MGYRLTKIYTRTGDDGTTSVDGKNRLLKNALRVEALGTLDELNCAIGVVLAQVGLNESVVKVLTRAQHTLFDLGGELCPPHHRVMEADKIDLLEQAIDGWNEGLPPLKEFVLPGGDVGAAQCHFARAVCRRAERCLVALFQEGEFNREILRYINRLSDVLFVGARVLMKDKKVEEMMWEHERKK